MREVIMDIFAPAILEGPNAKHPSPADIKKIVASLSEMRNKAKIPQTLQQLAIECVIQYRRRFIEHQENVFFVRENNPFGNLPSKIVEKLLSAVVDAPEVESAEKLGLLLQLLNSHVQEFDPRFTRDLLRTVPYCEVMFFRHMLQHCPKVKKANVSQNILTNFSILPRLHREGIFPLMASHWLNLSFLDVDLIDVSYLNRDQFSPTPHAAHPLKIICFSLPNLCGLDIKLLPDHFTMEDVECFSQMQHPKSLKITITHHITDQHCLIAVHAAGKTPSLEKFNFDVGKNADGKGLFLEKYAEMYPSKNLTLNYHWLDLSKKSDWPKCLSVENLRVYGKTLQFNLQTLPAPLNELFFEDTTLTIVYTVLKSLGGELTRLTVQTGTAYSGGSQHEEINIFTVISSCPRLKYLRVDTFGSILKDSIYRLPEGAFRNLSYFSIGNKVFTKVDAQISMLFKKFFLESQSMIKKRYVQSACELRAMNWALQENLPTCLDELEELKLKSVPNGKGRKDVLQVVGMLMQRSPFLKKVLINHHPYNFKPPKWFNEVMKSVDIALEANPPGCSEDTDENSSLSYDGDYSSPDVHDIMAFYNVDFDSDSNPQVEDIQSYLMWKDSL